MSAGIDEKKAMTQTIVADATVFSNERKATGHTAIYGIYFDTGKSAINPNPPRPSERSQNAYSISTLAVTAQLPKDSLRNAFEARQ